MIYRFKGIKKKISLIRHNIQIKNLEKKNVYNKPNYFLSKNFTNKIDNQLYFPYQDFPSINASNKNLVDITSNNEKKFSPCSIICLLTMLTFYYLSIILTKLKNEVKEKYKNIHK
jgi:hypothetical protein